MAFSSRAALWLSGSHGTALLGRADFPIARWMQWRHARVDTDAARPEEKRPIS